MVKVTLRITPSLAMIADEKNSDWLNLEKELPEGTTVSDLIKNLTSKGAGFRKMLIDPETGRVSDQIEFILNQHLLQSPDDIEIRLSDGDTVVFLPVYAGG